MSLEKLENSEKTLIAFFRITMGWTFLYAGIHHFGDRHRDILTKLIARFA
jgi:hypothetical protein